MMFDPTEKLALYNNYVFDDYDLVQSRSFPSSTERGPYFARESFEDQHRPSMYIARLQDPSIECDKNLGWNIDWAVASFVDRLESSHAAELFRDVRIRTATLESEGLAEEIPFRIFNKLDEALSNGHLRNAVFLTIDTLGFGVSGATYTHSYEPHSGVNRVSIVLNSDAIRPARARDLVAILIHHMIHAYFLVACGPQKEDEVDYGRLSHGVHFGKILLAVKKLSAVHGNELTSLDYSHRSVEDRYFADQYYGSRNRATSNRNDKKQWYCSHCHSSVETLSEKEVEKWYSKVCTPMFDQPKIVRLPEVLYYNDRRHELDTERRARLPSSAQSVEFILKDKVVLVERKKLDALMSIRRTFDQAQSRFLELDKAVSEATFRRFLEFIHTGRYPPDPTSFSAASEGLRMRKGPPIIKAQTVFTEAPLLADVQLVNLCSLMGFEECKAYALSRMDAYGITFEDPVAIFKEIYHRHKPDSDLEAWARRFLVQTPSTPSIEYYSALFIPEPPNLIKLESQSGPYGSRFLDAVDTSSALENDVNKARAELKAMGLYNSPWLPSHTSSSLLIADRGQNLSPHAVALGFPRPLPLLLGNSPRSLSPWSISAGLSGIANISTLELQRLTELERLRELDKLRETERTRDLDRERHKAIDLDRDRGGERELQAQHQAVAALEKFYNRGIGGDGGMY